MKSTCRLTRFKSDRLLERINTLYALDRHREMLQLALPCLAELDDPDYECTACMAANAHTQLHEFEAARSLAEAVLARNPESFWAHSELAGALLFLKRHAAALKKIRRAIALAPNMASGHYLKAVILTELWRMDFRDAESEALLREDGCAEESVRRALALEPHNPRHHALLADILHPENAAEVVRQGLALDPNHADLLGLQAERVKGRREKIALLRAALRSDPRHAGRQHLLALLGEVFERDRRQAVGVTAANLLAMLVATTGLTNFDGANLETYRWGSGVLLPLMAVRLARRTVYHHRLTGFFIAANLAILLASVTVYPGNGKLDAGALVAATWTVAMLALAGAMLAEWLRSLYDKVDTWRSA